jgi:peroxiredoxin
MTIALPRSLVLGFLLLAVAARAAAATPPAVGDVAPAFSLKTLDGRTVTLASLTAQGSVALVMLRGWPGYQCPLCTRQVNEFAGRAADFAAKGARAVFVYPGPADALQSRAKEFLADKTWPANFEFLLDPGYAFTNAYGLRWDAPRETAYPSTFVIGRGGKVEWAVVSKTHGGRTKVADVLARLP